MDIKEYQNKIRQALLQNKWDNVKTDKRVMKGGGVKKPNEKPNVNMNENPSSYGEDVKEYRKIKEMHLGPYENKGKVYKDVKPKKLNKTRNVPEYDEDIKSDSDNEIEGGNFIKSIKKLGNTLKNEGGKQLAREAVKGVIEGAKQGGKYLLTTGAEVAPVVAADAAEVAPLALMAAGMKKKRVVSDKMKRRSQLVGGLMKKHNMTMGEASSYIKQRNLKY